MFMKTHALILSYRLIQMFLREQKYDDQVRLNDPCVSVRTVFLGTFSGA